MDSAFCRFCGAAVVQAPAGASTGFGRRLIRRPDEGRLGGVCAGLAEYFDTDVTLVRVLWVILSLVPGGIIGGVVVYVAAWIIIPPQPGAPVRSGGKHLVRSGTDRQIAGVCGGLAAYLGVDSTVIRVIWAVLSIVPGAVVLGVIAYLLAWWIIPDGPVRLHAPIPAA
jgi:phage shock protein PspC (stress-responsive transcriptional regulator)